MATTIQHRGVWESAATGAGAELVGGLGAGILSILGLAGVSPGLMLSIAGIVLGAALVGEGAAIGAQYTRLLGATDQGTMQKTEFGGGLTVELLAGLAGVILGILALINVSQGVLMAVAAIIFGAALVFTSGAVTRLNDLKAQAAGTAGVAQSVAHEAVAAAGGAQVFAGLGSMVLGILALVGIQAMTLTLVAFLAVAVTNLLSGTAISGKIFRMFEWE